MGFGLMGAGAAVSGLMSGYQQGRKFAQDEERFGMEKERFGLEKEEAGQRKILRDEQIRGAKAGNVAAERANRIADEEDAELRDSIEIIKATYAPRQAPAGIADPASTAAPAQVPVTMTTPDGTEVQVPQTGGIAPPPGAARVAAPQSGPSLDEIQGMYNKLNHVGFRRILRTQGPAAVVQQALEMGKRFGDARTDAAIQALSGFNGGNAEQVSAALTQAGLPMPEGTKYERRDIEIIPGSGHKVADVVAISPDGKSSTSLHQLMRSRMTPAEIMRQDTDVGRAVADIAQRKVAEENLERFRRGELDLRGKTLNETIRHHGAMERFRLEEAGLLRDQKKDADTARAARNIEEASGNALRQILQLKGVSRETTAKDLEMLPVEERTRIQEAYADAVIAHGIWAMNRGSDFIPKITGSEALQVMKTPRSQIKSEGGEVFVMMGEKKVFLPSYLAPKPKPDPAAKPGPAVPVRGIAPPPAQ